MVRRMQAFSSCPMGIGECCCKIRKPVGPKVDSTFVINFFDQTFKVYEKPEPS